MAVTNAQNSLQSGEMKDQQSIASAQNSQASTAANNASHEVGDPDDHPERPGGGGQRPVQPGQRPDQLHRHGPHGAGRRHRVDHQRRGRRGRGGVVDRLLLQLGTSASSTSSAGSAGSGFITLTDLATLQVEAGFAETDAAKIELGQPATVTFNALPNQELQGKVSEIDVNSETVSNVVTYNVTVSIVEPPAIPEAGHDR